MLTQGKIKLKIYEKSLKFGSQKSRYLRQHSKLIMIVFIWTVLGAVIFKTQPQPFRWCPLFESHGRLTNGQSNWPLRNTTIPTAGWGQLFFSEICPRWPKPELYNDTGNKVHKPVSAILKSKSSHQAFIIHLAVKPDVTWILVSKRSLKRKDYFMASACAS